MSRKDFQGRTQIRKAGIRRLRDAETLLDSAKPRVHAPCAKYLAGYAIEGMLKFDWMEREGCWKLTDLLRNRGFSEKDVFSHSLENLAKMMPSLYNHLKGDKDAWKAFARVNQWKTSWRYRPGEETETEVKSARDFVEDVWVVYKWLQANRG